MAVVEPVEQLQHFSEGEPDLEPPEELAVGEVDDETLLEEGLDNEDIGEEDVDDDVLTLTLEAMIHVADDVDDGAAPEGEASPSFTDRARDEPGDDDEDDLAVLEVDDLEDLEESLDHLLEQRLALQGARSGTGEMPDEDTNGSGSLDLVGSLTSVAHALIVAQYVSGCGADEFVCRGCFLVRLRSQLADASAALCRDCQD